MLPLRVFTLNYQNHHHKARQHQQQVPQHEVQRDGVQGGPGNGEDQAADRLTLRANGGADDPRTAVLSFNALLIFIGLEILVVTFHLGDVVEFQMLAVRIGGRDQMMILAMHVNISLNDAR